MKEALERLIAIHKLLKSTGELPMIEGELAEVIVLMLRDVSDPMKDGGLVKISWPEIPDGEAVDERANP